LKCLLLYGEKASPEENNRDRKKSVKKWMHLLGKKDLQGTRRIATASKIGGKGKRICKKTKPQAPPPQKTPTKHPTSQKKFSLKKNVKCQGGKGNAVNWLLCHGPDKRAGVFAGQPQGRRGEEPKMKGGGTFSK